MHKPILIVLWAGAQEGVQHPAFTPTGFCARGANPVRGKLWRQTDFDVKKMWGSKRSFRASIAKL